MELETNILNHTKYRQQVIDKLKEHKLNERVNGYGLDIDASLSVSVVEARELMPMDYTGKSDPYVILKLGNTQQVKTNYIAQNLNPVWNEKFNFDVETGKEVLEIRAYDHDDFGSDDFLGSFALGLERYMDQQSHDEWFDLRPENQKLEANWHGRLRLVIQFIYSKTKMLTSYV